MRGQRRIESEQVSVGVGKLLCIKCTAVCKPFEFSATTSQRQYTMLLSAFLRRRLNSKRGIGPAVAE